MKFKNYNVEYYDDTHTYIVDGNVVPSVTGILHYLYPNKYANVNPEVLSAKANYGTSIHEAIQYFNDHENEFDYYKLIEEKGLQVATNVSRYKALKERYGFRITKQEQLVCNDKVAGRFDELGFTRLNKRALMDIKTTAILDKEYLSWQLSIYNYLNIEEDKAEELYAIWMPKRGDPQFVQIDFKSDRKVENLINLYHKERID